MQFFQCGYQAVSGWPGWRAVVTPLGKRSRSSSGGASASGEERRWWVDMPLAGDATFLHDKAMASGEHGGGALSPGVLSPGALASGAVLWVPSGAVLWVPGH